MEAYEGSGILTPFLTSARNGCEWLSGQRQALATVPPANGPVYAWHRPRHGGGAALV
jgi:hypothetical protein